MGYGRASTNIYNKTYQNITFRGFRNVQNRAFF